MSIGRVFKDILCYPFTDFKKFLKVFLMYLGCFLIIPVLWPWGIPCGLLKAPSSDLIICLILMILVI
jgi:hypothetical protein